MVLPLEASERGEGEVSYSHSILDFKEKEKMDGSDFFWMGGDTLYQNSYKPSQDL